MPLFSAVHLDDVFGVNGQVFVRVYDHTEESGVRLGERKTPSKLYSFCDTKKDC